MPTKVIHINTGLLGVIITLCIILGTGAFIGMKMEDRRLGVDGKCASGLEGVPNITWLQTGPIEE